MADLLPGDYVLVRLIAGGPWAGRSGTITWAGDGHGADRMYDVEFDDLPSATFCATEVTAVSVSQAEWDSERGGSHPVADRPVGSPRLALVRGSQPSTEVLTTSEERVVLIDSLEV